jgi:sugar-specific transcriptional regulator TrmB/DNA-binding CsgD family transcriptional regulator
MGVTSLWHFSDKRISIHWRRIYVMTHTRQVILSALGLSSDEEALYRALVDSPSATASTLSDALAMPAAEVEQQLALLHGQGLVARSTDGRYVATSPAIALGPLVRQRREDIRRAELELAALTERYWVSAGDRTAGDLVEVVTGVDLIASRFAHLQRSAEKEVRALVTASVAAVGRRDNPDEDEGVLRGVHYRVVIERAILEQQGAQDDTTGALSSGEDIRVVEKVPIKLLIADQNLAMVPMDATGRAPAALLVHRSGLLDALLALWDAVWDRARPLHLAADEIVESQAGAQLGEEDRQILMLLLAGLTDASIAGQLNMSMRTVQRRVRELMDLAGVHTRLQLGWHAAHAGWAA